MNETDEFEFFLEKPWSDGLPVVTPTEERIERMLAGTGRSPDDVVTPVPPLDAAATVRDVAAHAVMAGCKPEYFPVVIAALELIVEEPLNLRGVQATMHSVAPLLILNGPYAKKIGVTGGQGCFGPGFRANATIGRAVRLLLLNLGGGIARVACMSIYSQPSRFTFCVAENEDESPWESLAVSRGYAADQDVITAVMCENPHIVFNDVDREPERLLVSHMDNMAAMGSWPIWVRSDTVLVLSPEHARLCARAGFTRADVHAFVCENAGRTVGELKRGGPWRADRPNGRWEYPVERENDDFFIRAVNNPEDLHLIVAGGNGPLGAVMPGWNGASRAVHRAYEVV